MYLVFQDQSGTQVRDRRTGERMAKRLSRNGRHACLDKTILNVSNGIGGVIQESKLYKNGKLVETYKRNIHLTRTLIHMVG